MAEGQAGEIEPVYLTLADVLGLYALIIGARAAPALDRDRLREQLGVSLLVEVRHNAARSAVDKAGVPARLPVAL
jgi:hypothetical protein